MMLFYFLFVLFSGIPFASQVFVVKSAKDAYPISFATIYKVNICNAYSTVIEPPEGFTLQDIILGDSRLFKAERSDNRAILKRLAPDDASTNLVLILQGEDKVSHSLTFELTGEDSPRIANVQFFLPQERDKDPAVEAEQALCKSELGLTLWDQERRVTASVHDKTLENLQTFRLGGSLSLEKLGARVSLDAVMNSGGKGYVFFSTNAIDSAFDVVHLLGVKDKDIYKTVKLLNKAEDRGLVRYVYETTPFPMGKEHKYAFEFRIYRETACLNTKVE